MYGRSSSSQREDPRSLLTLQTPRGSTVQVSRVQAERALNTQGMSGPSSSPNFRTNRNAEVTAPFGTTSTISPSRSRTQANNASSPSNGRFSSTNNIQSSPSNGRFSSTSNIQSSPSNARKSASLRAQLDEREEKTSSSRSTQRGSLKSDDHFGQAMEDLDNKKSVPLGGFDVWPAGEIKPDYTKVDAVQQLLRTKLETLAGFSSDPTVVIKRAFKEATKGGDELTEDAFINLVQNKYNFHGYGPEIKALFKRFDVDRSGTISVQEFLDVILVKGATSFATTIGRVREVLTKRAGGVSSLKGLALQFKIMDSSRDNRVSREELEWGLNKFLRGYGLTLTDRELDALFENFDVDHDRSVSYEEFLHGIRGEMNDFRKNLVKQAFNIIDEDRSGTLTVAEIASRYDVSGHPLVKAGKCTPAEAIKTFMLQWQLHSKQKDDIIDLEEFLDYYDWISMSIDRDDYFELMIRNAWHISGGSGWSENTSNLRVLVTHMDGRNTIETIKDDLGLKRTDMEGIKARLAKQGIRAKKISLADASDL